MSYTASPCITTDDELIRTCAEHVVNLHAYNSSPAAEGTPEKQALWEVYATTLDAISDARPQTIEGMVAIARAAMAEAGPDAGARGIDRGCHSMEEQWSWNLMQDLLRLHGARAVQPDAGLINTCRKFAAVEFENHYRYITAPEDMADAQDVQPDREALNRIVATPATTPEGWQAKALACAVFCHEAFDDPEDGRDLGSPLLAALLRDMVGPIRDAMVSELAAKYGPPPEGYNAAGMWLGAKVPA